MLLVNSVKQGGGHRVQKLWPGCTNRGWLQKGHCFRTRCPPPCFMLSSSVDQQHVWTKTRFIQIPLLVTSSRYSEFYAFAIIRQHEDGTCHAGIYARRGIGGSCSAVWKDVCESGGCIGFRASGAILGRRLCAECVDVVGRGCRGSGRASSVAQNVWLMWAGGCEQGLDVVGRRL